MPLFFSYHTLFFSYDTVYIQPFMKALIKSSHSRANLDVFELTTENHAAYCSRHGYAYLPVEESYNPYVDVPQLLSYLEEYDVVMTIGCDLLIQHPEWTIEKMLSPGITMCPELRSGTLNADLVIYTRESIPTINKIADIQRKMRDGQTAFNHMKLRDKNIHINPRLQIAAPVMNPTKDYSKVCVGDYFAVHYHTIGKRPDVLSKTEGLKKDLGIC